MEQFAKDHSACCFFDLKRIQHDNYTRSNDGETKLGVLECFSLTHQHRNLRVYDRDEI